MSRGRERYPMFGNNWIAKESPLLGQQQPGSRKINFALSTLWAGLGWAGRRQGMVMGDHDAGNCGNGATAVTSCRGNNRVFI